MTMQETANLAKLLRELGLENQLVDFILGLEGSISVEEAARRIKSQISIVEKSADSENKE